MFSGNNGQSVVLITSDMHTHFLTLTKTISVLLLTPDTPLGHFFNQTQSP